MESFWLDCKSLDGKSLGASTVFYSPFFTHHTVSAKAPLGFI